MFAILSKLPSEDSRTEYTYFFFSPSANYSCFTDGTISFVSSKALEVFLAHYK